MNLKKGYKFNREPLTKGQGSHFFHLLLMTASLVISRTKVIWILIVRTQKMVGVESLQFY